MHVIWFNGEYILLKMINERDNNLQLQPSRYLSLLGLQELLGYGHAAPVAVLSNGLYVCEQPWQLA